MKRKLDKNKIYAFIGRAVVYSSLYMATVLGSVWALCQNTIYQEEKMRDLEKEKQEEREEKRRFYLSLVSLAIATIALIINLWFK